MPKIIGASQETNTPYLNLFRLQATQRDGTEFHYLVASRAEKIGDLKAISGKVDADAVAMFASCENKLILIRQFRYPVGDYIYELPAGLVDDGEDVYEAAIREMFEETGLHFTPDENKLSCFGKPYFSSPGMTDETCAIVAGYCKGNPTNANQEASEDIQVIFADTLECYRILKEEKTDMRTAWAILMWIMSDKNV